MNRHAALSLWMVGTIMIAAGTSFAVHQWQAHAESTQPDFHHWMHDHLELTPRQQQALEPVEHRFENTRLEIEARINTAGQDLAAAVRAGDGHSPAIDDALQRLHTAQSELQKATLDHFFEMKESLDPEQAEKLLQWTHDRLLHP